MIKLCLFLCLLGNLGYSQGFRLLMRVEVTKMYDPRLDVYAREKQTFIANVRFSEFRENLLITIGNDSLNLIVDSYVYTNKTRYTIYKINYQRYWLDYQHHENGLRITLSPLDPLIAYENLIYTFSFDSSVTSSIPKENN